MAEAARVLRGNIGFANVDGDVRTLLVSSSIRGEGKSVTACNLAVTMALAGQQVVPDADLRAPSVHTYMHVSNAVGLSSVLARRADLWDAVGSITLDDAVGVGAAAAVAPASSWTGVSRRGSCRWPGRTCQRRSSPSTRREPIRALPLRLDEIRALRVLPSGPLSPNPGEMAASERFGEVIGMLGDTTDLVIIDPAPLLEVGDAAAMALRVDGLLFVVNMARVKWPMLERSHAQLVKLPRRVRRVVVVAKRVHQPVHGYRYGSMPVSDL